jgi:hypothetical protein
MRNPVERALLAPFDFCAGLEQAYNLNETCKIFAISAKQAGVPVVDLELPDSIETLIIETASMELRRGEEWLVGVA